MDNQRQHLPLHRLHEPRQGGQARGGAATAGRESAGKTGGDGGGWGMSSTMHMHGGIGESIKRKEDARFLRGKGNYLDDFVLPNMLHMAILRSPHAHARIKSVDTKAASAKPGVIAVVTGELMAQH